MIQHPEKTCALVVGIDAYALGGDWALPGATIGAQRFVDWLRRQGLDSQRIYECPNARADDIRLVLHRLKQEREDCDCLLFYWAGHGFETEKEERCLFPTDARDFALKAFNIDDIIAYFRNETPQFTTQLGVIDACATGRGSWQAMIEPIQMSKQKPQGGVDCRFVLAASSGFETDYPDDGQPSLFTRRLLSLLDQAGMTTEALIDQLKGDYPIFVRDGRAKYWTGSQAQSAAWALEKEAFQMGASLHLEDAKWRAEARRIDATLDLPNASFRAIMERISGWERKLAGKTASALLLRGAALTDRDGEIRELIRNSALLSSSYQEAAQLVDNLGAFENPSYLIRTGYRPSNDLGVTGVWFLAGVDKCEPQRIFEPPEPASFEDAMVEITTHMDDNGISSRSLIQVVAPLRFLLAPQDDMIHNECDYPLVFRERNRSEGLEGFKRLRPKFRDQLLEVKRRAAQSYKWKWFETTDQDQWGSVEFPILRTGKCVDAEAQVERLLATLAPFAAITRLSIKLLGAVHEEELAQAICGELQFANIPVKLYQERNKIGSILPHLTIIWDDRELPKGYFH